MWTRPATPDDLAATYDLVRRSDTFWFGAPEHDEDEVREFFGMVSSWAADSLVALDGPQLLAVALGNENDTWYVADPNRADVADSLIDWSLRRSSAKLQALSRDQPFRDRLSARGWVHTSSMFDLLRAVSDDWALAAPSWPSGVSVRDFRDDDAQAVHHLIYVDAGWAEVPGHPHRDYESWRKIFVTRSTLPRLQALAWRGDRLVGVAMGRVFSDGTGWIAQLAVAKDERGRGLGRALLLEGLRRHRAGGASTLGLAVQAANRNALELYLSVGLRIDREWMEFRPDGS